MTKRFISCVFFALCFFVSLANNANAFVEKNFAVVQILDKAAGKAKTVSLPVGQKVEFEKLYLLTQKCLQTDPFMAENFYAFVEITKSDSAKIFSNWMNRNAPGENPVQNPDYDVWLLRCE